MAASGAYLPYSRAVSHDRFPALSGRSFLGSTASGYAPEAAILIGCRNMEGAAISIAVRFFGRPAMTARALALLTCVLAETRRIRRPTASPPVTRSPQQRERAAPRVL
jgi:hypothetical protein